jgi:hypothetical protein
MISAAIRFCLTVLLVVVPAAGCSRLSAGRAEAGCELDAVKFEGIHAKDAGGDSRWSDIAEHVELCMRIHGFKQTGGKGCIDNDASALARYVRATSPKCYSYDLSL